MAVLVITALQRIAPKEMLGRVMSLVMLAMVGLGPVSQALSGALMKISVTGLFAASGAGMALTGVLVFAQRRAWVFPPAEIAGENALSAPIAEPVSELGTA